MYNFAHSVTEALRVSVQLLYSAGRPSVVVFCIMYFPHPAMHCVWNDFIRLTLGQCHSTLWAGEMKRIYFQGKRKVTKKGDVNKNRKYIARTGSKTKGGEKENFTPCRRDSRRTRQQRGR